MLKIIKTEEEYRAALEEIKRLLALDPDADTPEGNALELLALVVEQYESHHYELGTPDPIDAISFRLEQQGLTQDDLIPFLGSKRNVSEIMQRKRPLTLEMIRALHEGLSLPAALLIQEYTATPH